MTHPSTVADKLDDAADLLSKPGAWTQGANARGADGGVVSPLSPEAVCWCSLGALTKAFGGYYPDDAIIALDAATFGIVSYNDARRRKQSDVVAAFRNAANIARGEVQP